MIKEIQINNFKSVRDLKLLLGRFNVLIGSNGSGKSNILEAIAFGGAASADRLDNEFLWSRGIRNTDARLMKSAFAKENFREPIKIVFKSDKDEKIFTITEENTPILKWVVKEINEIGEGLSKANITIDYDEGEPVKDVKVNFDGDNIKIKFASNMDLSKEEEVKSLIDRLRLELVSPLNKIVKENLYHIELANFFIFQPENSFLRRIEDEGQIKPLGVRGEGLFNTLQIFKDYPGYGQKTIDEIKEYLHIIEWFDDFKVVADNETGRKALMITDRNIPTDIEIFLNQYSVNEGFLFLLFYISLFISNETPAFFAIDNIEASFHPRLCTELIKNLVKLSKVHNKQVILTTHNPFVLDGLDLSDEDQKLFTVRRNADGETIADNVPNPPNNNIKLSEAWMRGYIGAQPETF